MGRTGSRRYGDSNTSKGLGTKGNPERSGQKNNRVTSMKLSSGNDFREGVDEGEMQESIPGGR